MKFQFSLTINDPSRSMNPENGVSICELGTLFCDMYAATDPGDKSKCILYGVSNHGYTPNFVTDSNLRYERFIDVHKNIRERGINDLTDKEAKYAKTLKRILKDGLFLEPHDKDDNLITTIYPSEIQETVKGYYTVSSIFGTISEMGSPSLEKGTHIYLHKTDYKIFTNKEQDVALRAFYRSGKLRLKVRLKKSLDTNRIINGTLIAFEPLTGLSLIDAVSTLPDSAFEVFEGINNQEDLFQFLDK